MATEQFRLPVWTAAPKTVEPSAKDTLPADAKLFLDNVFQLDFWRAPIDNERGNQMSARLGAWRNAGFEINWNDELVESEEDGAKAFARTGKFRNIDATIVEKVVFYNKAAKFSISIEKGDNVPDMPRFGGYFLFPAQADEDLAVEYYGRGPEENYSDRNTGSPFGLYQTTVDKMFVSSYSEPGEFGARTDCRRVSLTNEKGAGYRVTALSANGVQTSADAAASFTFSARRMLNRDLESVEHAWELPRRDFVVLNVDFAQQGVGGDDSWGAQTYPQFRLSGKSYSYEFLVEILE